MIEVTVDSQAVQRALRDLEIGARRMAPAFKDIGERLVNTTGERFRDSKGPDGEAWERNSPVTLARKSSDRPLIGKESDLQGSIFREADDQSVVVGSAALKYAAMQQFGGKKSDYPHLWADIPARPFIGLSADDENEIGEIVMKHLLAAARL